MKMIIKNFEKKDIEKVIRLCHSVWPDLTIIELKKHFAKKIRKQDNNGFVAIEDNKIVGFIGFSEGYFRDSDYLDWVFVDKEYRGKGIAERLIKEFEKDAKKRGVKRIFSTTIRKNKPVMKMQKKLGYKRVGYVWNLWEEGDKEIFFSKKLGGGR
jgi:GNAT superfamily N-acetyltransferase